MRTYPVKQERTFYQQLQTCIGLDLRDVRGKHHDLSFVLLGLMIGLFRKRDGCLSSIHRSMVNKNKELCLNLGIKEQKVISRSYLPILLQKVSLVAFTKLLFDNYGIALNSMEKEWFSADGKELRGSIEKGNTRGEAIVQIVRHSDRDVLGQSHYNGNKESEKPCLQQLLLDTGAAAQKVTMDALHLCPQTTSSIEDEKGVFLIGLKNNQQRLLADMKQCSSYLSPIKEAETLDKGHGRIEKRSYSHYNIKGEYFDERWKDSNFQSLFKVKRVILTLEGISVSSETSYYISNGNAEKSATFFQAIRNHWSVEINNHQRDVVLKEDKLRTKKPISRLFSGFRTLTMKIINLVKPKNMIAQLELFQDDFSLLFKTLKKIKFL